MIAVILILLCVYFLLHLIAKIDWIIDLECYAIAEWVLIVDAIITIVYAMHLLLGGKL